MKMSSHIRLVFFFLFAVHLFFSLPPLPTAWPLAKAPPREERSEAKKSALPTFSLKDCYQLALKRSETVAIKKEGIAKAEANFFKATSEVLGDVNFVMTDTRQDARSIESEGSSSSVGSTFTLRDRGEAKFVIKQPLFQGFKTLGALTGAGGLKGQRKQEWLRAKELLFLDVTRSFYQILRSKKDVETIEQIHALFTERIAELSDREKIGRSRASEVAQASAKLKSLEAELAHSRGVLAIGEHILEFLTGISIPAEQLRDHELPEDPEKELNDYLETVEMRPDVEAAKQAMNVARRNIIIAQSGLWPEISIENNRYTHREGFQSNIDWDLLLKIDLPLFKGGETVGKIKEAVSNFKQEKLSYSLVKREAELEIKEAYQEWTASVNQFKALKASVDAAEENFRLQKEEYDHNLVNNLDVIQALEAIHEATREANQIYYQMKENYWSLRIATGNCCESI